MNFDDAPHPSNIEWKNFAYHKSEKLFFCSMSIIISLLLIVVAFLMNYGSERLKDKFDIYNPLADCAEVGIW